MKKKNILALACVFLMMIGNLSGKVAVVLTVAVQQDECLCVRMGRGVFQIKNLCVCALHKTAAWLHRASLLLRI